MNNYKSNEPCLACGLVAENMVTYHHIITRKSGGTDDKYNLMSLCLRHHNEIHQKGTSYMAEKYPVIRNFLISHNWEFCEFLKKWRYYPNGT